MPIETPVGNLDIKNATLRTSNLETQNIKIGSIFVGTGNSLEETANVGNSMSNTIQFTNTHTAFTTTGNVEVGGELTVSGNVSDLNVVSNVNLLHTSNTASIKLNSNVVTEFPRSKKLIKYPRVALGTNGSPNSGTGGGYTLSGYTVKASDEYNTTTYTASKAFTNTNAGSGDTWISTGSAYTSADGLPVANSVTVAKFGQNGSWLEIKLPNTIQLHSTRVFGRHTHFTERSDTADIWASNTGTDGDWVKLTTINFNDTYTDVIPMVADIDTQAYYQYFAIQITKIEWNGTYANIGEWELYGLPEYDPEADGVDVVVKSVANVPNTDFLDVFVDAGNASGFTLSGSDVTGVTDLSTPANTMTVNGNVTYNSANKAFVFPGTGSSYMRATLVDGNDNYPLTLSVWFMMTDYDANSWRSIITVGTSGTGEQASIAYDPNQDQLYFGTYGADIYVPHTPELGKWYHVAATFTGGSTTSSTMNVYLNGVNMGGVPNGTQTPSFTNNQFVIGGAMNSNGTTVNNPFKGQIANARFYRRAYTSDEIYQLYAYQKEYFGHGDLGMTLKAGRLGLGTSEPRAALDVRGDTFSTVFKGGRSTFLAWDYLGQRSTSFSAATTFIREVAILNHTFDIPSCYHHLGTANLKAYVKIDWRGESERSWNFGFRIELHGKTGDGTDFVVRSSQSDNSSTLGNKINGLPCISYHESNFDSTPTAASITSMFSLPNCDVSPGSTLLVNLVGMYGDSPAAGTVLWTGRTSGFSDSLSHELPTSSFFVVLDVEDGY